MTKVRRADDYFEKQGPFKEGMDLLRQIALETELEENVKWGGPVYTIDNKNVMGIMSFKRHFGLWFFNGVYLSDPQKVLENAQEGKTKAMRHWKFTAKDQIDRTSVKAYIKEAIANQKKGMEMKPEPRSGLDIPESLKRALSENEALQKSFDSLSTYKKKEFAEYISSAKMEKTRQSRLEKALPLISRGIGLNDKYRKS